MDDIISRQAAIDALETTSFDDYGDYLRVKELIKELPATQPKEVIPHRNYKYLSDYWCECGWHLGKMSDVKYCPECGGKVNWMIISVDRLRFKR